MGICGKDDLWGAGMNSLKSRVFIYQEKIDMRKGYGGLYALVRELNPLSGDYFLFMGKDRKKAKVLFWDGTGLNIWMKRMEKGRFADIFLRSEMSASELRLFMEGSMSVKQRIAPKDLTHTFAA